MIKASISQRRVAYIAAELPKLSETFVYNELFSVRAAGVAVVPVSVYRPATYEDDTPLRELARESIVVYRLAGMMASISEFIVRPLNSVRTLALAMQDAVLSSDATFVSRLKCLYQAIAAIGLARQLRGRGVEHIHAHMANTPTAIAMYCAAQLGIHFSFTGHANDIFVHRAFLPEKLNRAAFSVCISHWHREYYSRILPLPIERLPVIRCGVARINVATDEKAHVRRDSHAPIKLLSVGRLVHKKGMDTIVLAIDELGPDFSVQCDIVGDGPIRDELQALIDSRNLQQKVHLLGAKPNHEALERMRQCDAFVLACRCDPINGDQDGIPVSLMEAMAAGKCVITSDLAPITELVIDGKTGLCVSDSNASGFASAIRRIGEEPDYCLKLGEAGRSFVNKNFDRQANADLLCSLIVACVESSRLPELRKSEQAALTE